MVLVSQNEKISMWSPQTEPTTRSPETDPTRSPQTAANACVDAEGQALHERLRAFHMQAVRKIQSFNAPSRDSPALP